MSRIIGIDLGTTNSRVAVLDDKGQPRTIPHPGGERTMPSCVSWPEHGPVLVGERARRQGITNAAATVFGAKRLIGRKVNADEVAAFARGAPFPIAAAPNGDAWVRIRDQPISPQEIAAHLLRALRRLAEEALGEPVTRAVLTVPAYAGDAQRQATRDAAQIAGLDVIRILNEPTAAALAYGAHRAGDGRRLIAVFDLGGGTFDISIMSVERGIFEVLATGGDSALGGQDWDRRLAEQIAEEVRARHGVDVTGIPMASSRLRDAAEVTKKALAAEREATITLPFLAHAPGGQPIHYERAITRAEVEELTRELIERLEPPCRRALADAGLAPDRLDEVLLVGGMTRWPAVQAMVQRIFGKRPARGGKHDEIVEGMDGTEGMEIVARGAAAYGGILAGLSDDAQLLDVTPHDIGIKVSDDQLAIVVPRNSLLPVRARHTFATTSDDQRSVAIELYQGASSDLAVAENRRLGQVMLDDLPPGPAGSVRVELVIDVDVESILSVSATELPSGRETAATIQPSGGLSQREIVEIIARRRHEQEAGAEAEGAVRVTTRDQVVSRPGEDEDQ